MVVNLLIVLMNVFVTLRLCAKEDKSEINWQNNFIKCVKRNTILEILNDKINSSYLRMCYVRICRDNNGEHDIVLEAADPGLNLSIPFVHPSPPKSTRSVPKVQRKE